MCERFEERARPYIDAYQASNGIRPLPVTVYGDATGQSRFTAAKTDYDLIREYFRSKPDFRLEFAYPNKNPPVKDRINSVNAMLKNSAGLMRAIVHPRCKELITDFLEVTWKKNSENFELDKVSDKRRTHLSDAFGYLVWQEARIEGFDRRNVYN